MAAMEKNKTNLNVPHLRFPEFSGEWGKATLQSVAAVSKGAGISKDQLSEEGQPCILYGELYTKYNSEIIDTIISKTDIDPEKLVRSQANDVIIPCSGESAVDIATARCVKQSKVLLGGDLNIIRLKGEHDGSFFAYQLNGKRKYDIAKVAQGVSVVHLYGEHLKRVMVNYPSATEQKKISSLLALIDQRIETQKKVIEKYESLIRGIVKTHYSQCESIKEARISELGKAFTTMNMSKEDLSEDGNECILYGELFTTYGCVIKDVKSKTNISTERATKSRNNDLLFPASTTVDAMSLIAPTAIYKEGVILGGDLFGIHVNEDYNNEYLSYLINYIYKSTLARYAQGSTIIHLHYSDIKNVTLLLPSIEDQNYLAHLMRSIEAKINLEKDMLTELYRQKAYLLSNLFI